MSLEDQLLALLERWDIKDLRGEVELQAFAKWRMQVLLLLHEHFGRAHPYTEEFALSVRRDVRPDAVMRQVEAGKGVLEALIEDLQSRSTEEPMRPDDQETASGHIDTTWTRCKELLGHKLNDHVMAHWIEPMVCEDISDTKIILSVPSNFFTTWMRERYLQALEDSLLQVTGRHYEIDFQSQEERSDESRFEIEDESTDDGARLEVGPSPAGLTDEFARSRNLNPRYTFESFVVGGCNRFAHAAAISVAENLGGSYNPLFIYGGDGLGKTHLMSAIGFEVLSRDKTKKISFATSEEFTNEMINSIRYDKMIDFRNKYRNVDLLLIDDIQFIAGKERTQEEFFHTFQSMYEDRKQIVLTSDRSPNEISKLEHRLRSRFCWGLIADMGMPDLETRVAILQRKCFEDGTDLPDEVAYFLADHVRYNVRELAGYLVRLVAMSKLQGLPLTQELARLALGDRLQRNPD